MSYCIYKAWGEMQCVSPPKKKDVLLESFIDMESTDIDILKPYQGNTLDELASLLRLLQSLSAPPHTILFQMRSYQQPDGTFQVPTRGSWLYLPAGRFERLDKIKASNSSKPINFNDITRAVYIGKGTQLELYEKYAYESMLQRYTTGDTSIVLDLTNLFKGDMSVSSVVVENTSYVVNK